MHVICHVGTHSADHGIGDLWYLRLDEQWYICLSKISGITWIGIYRCEPAPSVDPFPRYAVPPSMLQLSPSADISKTSLAIPGQPKGVDINANPSQ